MLNNIIDVLFAILIIFCAYSLIFPWEHKQFDIVNIDGLFIDADLKPQIGFMLEREVVNKDYKCIYICFPFIEIQIQYGNNIKEARG